MSQVTSGEQSGRNLRDFGHYLEVKVLLVSYIRDEESAFFVESLEMKVFVLLALASIALPIDEREE